MTNLKSLIELLNDDSMKMITPLMADRQYTYNMLWLRLLTLAAELDKNGEISAPNGAPFDKDILLQKLHLSDGTFKIMEGIRYFDHCGLLKCNHGVIRIKNWKHYLAIGGTIKNASKEEKGLSNDAIRQRRCRLNKKLREEKLRCEQEEKTKKEAKKSSQTKNEIQEIYVSGTEVLPQGYKNIRDINEKIQGKEESFVTDFQQVNVTCHDFEENEGVTYHNKSDRDITVTYEEDADSMRVTTDSDKNALTVTSTQKEASRANIDYSSLYLHKHNKNNKTCFSKQVTSVNVEQGKKQTSDHDFFVPPLELEICEATPSQKNMKRADHLFAVFGEEVKETGLNGKAKKVDSPEEKAQKDGLRKTLIEELGMNAAIANAVLRKWNTETIKGAMRVMSKYMPYGQIRNESAYLIGLLKKGVGEPPKGTRYSCPNGCEDGYILDRKNGRATPCSICHGKRKRIG